MKCQTVLRAATESKPQNAPCQAATTPGALDAQMDWLVSHNNLEGAHSTLVWTACTCLLVHAYYM